MRNTIQNTLIFLFAAFLLSSVASFAQPDKKFIREGNKNFKNEKYSDAEISYRRSLEQNPNSVKGHFNLGDALYKQQNFEQAAEKFNGLIQQKDVDNETLSKAYYNLGNSLLQNKKYQESIDAYKKSLKLSPNDMDAKYNLEYAKRMIVQQQQQQQNQNKDQNKDNQQQQQQQQQQQNQNKDQNKDNQQQQQQQQQQQNQNKDQNKDNQQQQQQQNQEQNKENKQQGQPQKQKISKEDAERMLQALSREEQNTQKKLKKIPAGKAKLQKNW